MSKGLWIQNFPSACGFVLLFTRQAYVEHLLCAKHPVGAEDTGTQGRTPPGHPGLESVGGEGR